MPKGFRWVVLASMALTLGAVPRSFAEEVAPAGEYQEGIHVDGWTVFPSIFVGGVYNTNVNQSATGTDRSSDFGLRVAPHVAGTYDGGIHKTTFYGVVDAEFFNGNTVAANMGVAHAYQPMQDLTFNFYGNYTRETDIFNNALNFNNGAIYPTASPNPNIPIIINPFGTTPGVNPIAFNQFTAGASVTKTIDQVFVTLSGTAFYIAFDHPDNAPAPFQTTHDGANYWVSGKVGYHVAPQVYVFAEGDGIFQRFNNSLFDTNGYRVLGGVGSDDPQSLFRGEVFGGYQVQNQQNQVVTGSGIPTDVNSGVFGGRLTYFPTQYWTITAQVDESLGISTTLASFVPQGVPTRVTTAILQTNYGLSRAWSVGVRGGYTQGDFIGESGFNNHAWMAGASFNYEIWRNLLLTLDFQYTTGRSDAAFSDFTREQYTAGVIYKY
jgi:hypothetical protein